MTLFLIKKIKVMGVALICSAFVFAMPIFSNAWAMSAPEYYELAKVHSEINAFAATVQSALETRHWTSPLWRIANNGAGIKAPPSWRKSNPYIEMSSPESKNSVYFQKVSYFRKYATPQAFLSDYKNKIGTDYPFCKVDNVWGYFAGLYKGRLGSWATDHRYFEKLAKKAVELEPILLYPGHLRKSFEYAKNKNYLKQWQIKIIEAVLK